jgi:Fur family ferric uptake transcriptional regulator
MTEERRTILEQLVGTEGHFDAEGLCERLRASGAKVSRATVYRTIGHLVDAGLLRKYDLGDRRTLYETAVGRHHHEHMICVVCGEILEFVEERIERLQDEVCRQYSFRPLSHTLHIHGICRSCDRRGQGVSEAGSPEESVPMVWRKQAMRS